VDPEVTEATDEGSAGVVPPDIDLGGDELSVTTRRDGARSIVVISGELDLTVLEPLRAKLSEAVAEGVDTVEVDTSGVSFIDSVALAMFLAFQVNLPKEGVTLRVVAASDEFARIVTLSGLADALLPPADPADPGNPADPTDAPG